MVLKLDESLSLGYLQQICLMICREQTYKSDIYNRLSILIYPHLLEEVIQIQKLQRDLSYLLLEK